MALLKVPPHGGLGLPQLSSQAARGGRPRGGAAPIITIMDHRGCNRGGPNKEYFGIKANGPEDEMCVKVQSKKIEMNQAFAEKFLQEIISLKEKGIDGTYSSNA